MNQHVISLNVACFQQTSTLGPSTARSDMPVDDLQDEGFISTPLDEDDSSTLTLGNRNEEKVTSADDGTSYMRDEIDFRIEGALREENSEGEHVEEREQPVREEAATIKSEDLKLETREQVDDLTVEGDVREEAKVQPSSETIKITRPVRGM